MFKLLNRAKLLNPIQENNKFRGRFYPLYTSIYKKLQNPEMIEWFPTYHCNSACQYCGGYDKETISTFGKLIPHKTITRIIELSGKSGTNIWNIGGRGGEPLFYPNLISVLEAIKENNMKGILITNGLLLNEGFLTRLVNAKWDVLRISLDSHIPEIHDEARGIKGNFEKIDKALMLLNKLKKEDNLNSPNIICCPVITNKSYRHIIGYIDYCIERGVDEIQFMPLLNVHERAGKLMLSDAQKSELVNLLEGRHCENNIAHNINFIISLYSDITDKQGRNIILDTGNNNRLYCIHLWKTLVISEDGYLSPCSLIKRKLLKVRGSFLKAWNSKIMNELRKKILKGELIDSVCKVCCGPLRNETYDFNQYLLKNAT